MASLSLRDSPRPAGGTDATVELFTGRGVGLISCYAYAAMDAFVKYLTEVAPGPAALGFALGFAFAVWFWYDEIRRGRR